MLKWKVVVPSNCCNFPIKGKKEPMFQAGTLREADYPSETAAAGGQLEGWGAANFCQGLRMQVQASC